MSVCHHYYNFIFGGSMQSTAIFKYTLGSVLILCVGSLAHAECPKLTLDTLPKALCAKNVSFMSSNMSYTSSESTKETCASDATKVSIFKTLQGIFKGQKEYSGEETITQPGKMSCTYTLPENWKKSLKTDDATFTIVSTLKTPVTSGLSGVGGTAPSLCPQIDYAALKDLKDGHTMEVKRSTLAGGQTFEWNLQGKINTKTLAFAGQEPSTSEKLAGTFKVEQPLIQSCTYTYKPSGVVTKFTLTGTQTK
jgi:hypothetical protein